MAHAWKACWVKALGGSNPPFSARAPNRKCRTRGGTVVAAGSAERVKLRPLAQLFSQGLVAVVAFMTPVFIVLYVTTIPSGPWRAVLVTQVLATAVVVFGAAAYFR